MTEAHRGAAPAEDAPFILLQTPERSERKSRILGAVIPKQNYATPFLNYRPSLKYMKGEDKVKLDALMQTLWEGEERETVNLTDIITAKRGATLNAAQTKLTELFEAHAKKATKTDVRIKAGKAKHFTWDNVGASLQEALTKSPQWKDEVLKLYNATPEKRRDFLLVTGVYLCSDIEVSWDTSDELKFGGKAKIPVGELAGNPVPVINRNLDLGFEFDREKTNSTEVFAKCADTVIFALSYNEIIFEVEEVEEAKAQSFFKKIWPGHSKKRKASVLKDAYLGDQYAGLGIDPYAAADTSESVDQVGNIFVVAKPNYKNIDEVSSVSSSPLMMNGSFPQNGAVRA